MAAGGQETLKYMTKLAEAYLLRDDVQVRIFECAQTLVKRRSQWVRRDWGVRYQCVYGDCLEDDIELADLDTMSLHLLFNHPHLDLSGNKLTSISKNCVSVVL